MFITKKHLSRRTVLRGVGAAIALPMLDAMVPALASTPQKPLVKMGFIYFPHGAVMSKWTPDAEGKSFELAQILSPLEPFKRQLTIVSGLEIPFQTYAAAATLHNRSLPATGPTSTR